MKPQPADTGLLARAVREAVECFASPDITHEVIGSALSLSGRSDIPEAGRAVMVFVENALFAAVEDRLGSEIAMMIVDQLRPIASMASSQEVSEVRPTLPPVGLFDSGPEPNDTPAPNERATKRPPAPALVLDMDEDDDEPELTIDPLGQDDLDLDFELTGLNEDPDAWEAAGWEAAGWADGDDAAWETADSSPADSGPAISGNTRENTPTSPPTAEAIQKRRALAAESQRNLARAHHVDKPRPARWTDPEPETVRVVLVCTADPMRAAGMGRALAGTARVQPVSDALAILSEPADLLVVDCVRPTVRLETLLSVVPDLPSDCRVVLWGEAPDFRKRLGILGGAIPDSWVSCGADADAEDVATVCRVLVS